MNRDTFLVVWTSVGAAVSAASTSLAAVAGAYGDAPTVVVATIGLTILSAVFSAVALNLRAPVKEPDDLVVALTVQQLNAMTESQLKAYLRQPGGEVRVAELLADYDIVRKDGSPIGG